jgi:hypothetical protein
MTVNARGDLIEADLPLGRDADVDEGDDTLVTQAIPIDDSLVSPNHPLPFELAYQMSDLILGDVGERGDASRIAASVSNECCQHAPHCRITAVQTPLVLLAIQIEVSQAMSPLSAIGYQSKTARRQDGKTARRQDGKNENRPIAKS